MSEDADKGHFGPAALNKLHKQHRARGTTENGACLTGHEPNFKGKSDARKWTCNYRYQSYERALSHGPIKQKLHSYKNYNFGSAKIRTSAYVTKNRKSAPARYCAALEVPGKGKPGSKPEPGDWDLDGPHQDIKRKNFARKTVWIKAGMNFSQDTWPYWNNAHHLIPKGTLKKDITAQPAKVSNMIQKALLTAKYNVNHQINMFLLPQDKRVAKILGLCRHIQLAERDRGGVEKSYCDHPEYNRLVSQRLEKIIKSYKRICDDKLAKAKKKHPIPNAKLDKAKLENLSKLLLRKILAWGVAAPGMSLSRAAVESEPQATKKPLTNL
jgi:hypothetical protein